MYDHWGASPPCPPLPVYSLLTSDQYQSNSGVKVLGMETEDTCLINYCMSINSKMWTNRYNTA